MTILSTHFYGTEELLLLQKNSGRSVVNLACIAEKKKGEPSCLGEMRSWFWRAQEGSRRINISEKISCLKKNEGVSGLGGIYMEEGHFWFWGWGDVRLYAIRQRGSRGCIQKIEWEEFRQAREKEGEEESLRRGYLEEGAAMLLCSRDYGGAGIGEAVRECLSPVELQRERQAERRLQEIAALGRGRGSAVFLMRR